MFVTLGAIVFLVLLILPQFAPIEAHIRNFLQCHLCETVNPAGKITDCACDFYSVNLAVESFFRPLLRNITRSTFFRYFRVDLERPCPFWQEEGQCTMEGCSVCACDEQEVPRNWFDEQGSVLRASPALQQNSANTPKIVSPKSITDDKIKFNAFKSDASLPTTITQDNLAHNLNLIDGVLDYNLRQQSWHFGNLLQTGPEENSQMSSKHIAQANREDASMDSDYDSYFMTNDAYDNGKRGTNKNTGEKAFACKAQIIDSINTAKGFLHNTCDFDPELNRWTDMVEDDCAQLDEISTTPRTEQVSI